jgi:hypothetical protein
MRIATIEQRCDTSAYLLPARQIGGSTRACESTQLSKKRTNSIGHFLRGRRDLVMKPMRNTLRSDFSFRFFPFLPAFGSDRSISAGGRILTGVFLKSFYFAGAFAGNYRQLGVSRLPVRAFSPSALTAGFSTCLLAGLSSIIAGLSSIIAGLSEVTGNPLNPLKAVFRRLFNVQTDHFRRKSLRSTSNSQ